MANIINFGCQTSGGALICNPNLLHNWYFGNPINQRKVSGTISDAGYFLDRWKLTSGTVTINTDSITLDGTMIQILENSVGDDVVATVLTDSGVSEIIPSYDDTEKTLTVTASGVVIHAVKLEIGSQQTLAHKNALGSWVLNEIPDYGSELAKCQRFYFEPCGTSGTLGLGLGGNNGSMIIYMPIPVTMRKTPSVTADRVGNDDNGNYITIEGVVIAGFNAHQICLLASGAFTNNKIYSVRMGNAYAYLRMSADL